MAEDFSERSASSRTSSTSVTGNESISKLSVRGLARNALSPFKGPRKGKYVHLDSLDESFGDLATLLEKSQEFSEEMLVKPNQINKTLNGSSNLDYSGVTAATCDESFSQVSFDDGDDGEEEGEEEGEEAVRMGHFLVDSAEEDTDQYVIDTNIRGSGVLVVAPTRGSRHHYQLKIAKKDAVSAPKLQMSMLKEHDRQQQKKQQMQHPQNEMELTPPNLFSSRVKDELDISCRSADSLDLSRERRKTEEQEKDHPPSPARRHRRRGRRRQPSVAAYLVSPSLKQKEVQATPPRPFSSRIKNELDISCRSTDSLDLSRQRRKAERDPPSPTQRQRRGGRRPQTTSVAAYLACTAIADESISNLSMIPPCL